MGKALWRCEAKEGVFDILTAELLTLRCFPQVHLACNPFLLLLIIGEDKVNQLTKRNAQAQWINRPQLPEKVKNDAPITDGPGTPDENKGESSERRATQTRFPFF